MNLDEIISNELADYYKPDNIKARISDMKKTFDHALEIGDLKAAIVASDGLQDAVKRLDTITRITKPFQTQSE